jgi:hypothetical protein
VQTPVFACVLRYSQYPVDKSYNFKTPPSLDAELTKFPCGCNDTEVFELLSASNTREHSICLPTYSKEYCSIKLIQSTPMKIGLQIIIQEKKVTNSSCQTLSSEHFVVSLQIC